MVLIVPEQSQRPYRFGMTLLCVGALFNWLGLADNYSEPVPAIRYIGVGLIAAGASLICMAMCFWMRTIRDPTANIDNDAADYNASTDPIHIIAVDITQEKPPDYSTVVDIPPCYEDAIRLNPSSLLTSNTLGSLKSYTTNNNAALPSSNELSSCRVDNDGPKTMTEVTAVTATDYCCNSSSQQPQQNSSHNENSFAKVLRKSIREIRKQLKSNVENSSAASTQTSAGFSPSPQSSTSDNDAIVFRATTATNRTDVCKNTADKEQIR